MVIGEMLREGGGLMFTWAREPLVEADCMQMGPDVAGLKLNPALSVGRQHPSQPCHILIVM